MSGALNGSLRILVVCAVGMAALSGKAVAAAAEQTVLEADRAFVRALVAGDGKAIEKALDSNFSWTDTAGNTKTRSQVLKNLPASVLGDESDAEISEQVYGRVGVVRANRGKTHALRIWVKQKPGWRALVLHEVTQREKPAPAAAPGPRSDVCDNPCKGIPYKTKSEAERAVLKSWQVLETAVTDHDADAWAPHFRDEFALVSSNGVEPSTKAIRMATIRKQKEAGVGTAPPPLTWAQMYPFGDTLVMVSTHQPRSGKPLRVSRVWVKGTEWWQMAVSFQTAIQDAPTQ